jgi:hypothetical protein
MQKLKSIRRVGRKARFCLSARGSATEFGYRSRIIGARGSGGSSGRTAFEGARVEWAHLHGLEPDDGAYLGELAAGAATLNQLGEAMAICGQSREAVMNTMERLVSRGFVDAIEQGGVAATGSQLARARGEVSVAEAELQFVRLEFQAGVRGDRHRIQSPLREALYRVVDARRFVARLSRRRAKLLPQ